MGIDLVTLVLGVVLLTTGKKLYWLFVGVIGFIIGLAIGTQFVGLEPWWLVYAVALGAGIIGAVLAYFLQRLAISLVGFIVGGYGAMQVTTMLGVNAQPNTWMAFIVGGFVGLLLVSSVFNWALYLLSTWAGATLVVKAIGLEGGVGLVLFFALFVLGMVIQVGLFRDRTKKLPAEVKLEVPQPKS